MRRRLQSCVRKPGLHLHLTLLYNFVKFNNVTTNVLGHRKFTKKNYITYAL